RAARVAPRGVARGAARRGPQGREGEREVERAQEGRHAGHRAEEDDHVVNTARVGPVEIVYETIGDPSDPPLLLVMGLGMQLIHWDIELCELLAERGFHVIRFDNRDAGLSTKIDAPVPNVRALMARIPSKAPYLVTDMAGDAFGLLAHPGLERAPVAA